MNFSFSRILSLAKVFDAEKPLSDLDTFAMWYDQNQKMVRSIIFHLCGKNDLDDLVQEVFIKVWNQRKTFRGDAKVSTWIYRITINTAKDYLRRKKTPALPLEMIVENDVSDSFTHHTHQQMILKKALHSLDPDDRILILLQGLYEFSFEEIAHIANLPLGTVKSRLHYLKKNLKEQLSAMENQP